MNYFSVFRYPSKGLKLWNFLDNFDFKGKFVAKFLLRKRLLSIYDNKTKLLTETFKKYVTRIMIFFIPFTCVTLCKLYFKTSPMLLKISNYGMRKMKIFCIYDCFSMSHYISKEVENCIKLLYNRVFLVFLCNTVRASWIGEKWVATLVCMAHILLKQFGNCS